MIDSNHEDTETAKQHLDHINSLDESPAVVGSNIFIVKGSIVDVHVVNTGIGVFRFCRVMVGK